MTARGGRVRRPCEVGRLPLAALSARPKRPGTVARRRVRNPDKAGWPTCSGASGGPHDALPPRRRRERNSPPVCQPRYSRTGGRPVRQSEWQTDTASPLEEKREGEVLSFRTAAPAAGPKRPLTDAELPPTATGQGLRALLTRTQRCDAERPRPGLRDGRRPRGRGDA